MTNSNIQTLTRTMGEMIESIIQFFINLTSGWYLILFGFFFVSLIVLIFHFFEEIIEWVGKVSQ